MTVKMRKVDKLWEDIFNDFNIEEKIERDGFFEIKAKEIKKYNEEPRLMTKFDNTSALPNCFFYDKDKKKRSQKAGKHLSILPTTRGRYIIGAFDAYHRLDKLSDKVKRVQFPSQYETLNIDNINSEATALNVAYVSGILNDFIGDDNLMPTVNGRMASGHFSFDMALDTKKIITGQESLAIKIQNSQIEIDAGYEGDNTLSLIEAKNVISDDFLVRQVYFPYRMWSNKVGKPINNIFMTYSNEMYNLYQYQFEDINSPSSIKLVKSQIYTFNPPIDLDTIVKIANEVKVVREPEVPFPQADDFKKVLSLCEALNRSEKEIGYEPLTKVGVSIKFGFHIRQSDYYINAARYLGFVKLVKGKNAPIELTDRAKRIFSSPPDEKNKKIVEAILAHEVFNKCFKIYLKQGRYISTTTIIETMRECNLYNLDRDSTYGRRASSISSWINWIMMLTNEGLNH